MKKETNYTSEFWKTTRNENLGASAFLFCFGALPLIYGNYEGNWKGGVLFVFLFLIIPALIALGYGLWANKKYKKALEPPPP